MATILNYLPSLPWFTWLLVTALTLVMFGILGALLGIIGQGARWCLYAAWTGLQALVVKLTGCRFRSWGTAHWAGLRELKRGGLLNTSGIAIGEWRGKRICEPRGGHILIMAPPRSGKSYGLIMPALREYQGSCLVTDLRGELFEKTSHDRERFGPVYRFDPGGTKSASFNVLDAVRWGSPYQYGDLMRMLRHIFPVRGDISDIYRSSAIPLGMSVLLYGHREGLESFPAIARWMLDPSQTMDEKLQTLASSSDVLIQQGARRTIDAGARMRQSFWTTLLDPLTLFCDPVIASHTEQSDVTFDDLMYGAQPCSLYLSMGFHEIPRLGPLLGLMVDVLTALVGSPETPPRHKLLMCLDEAANLGRLTELERAVSYLQGSGVQTLLAFQNISQFEQTYGEDSPLLSSVTSRIFYTPADTRTAATISMALGEATVPVQTVSAGGQVTVGEHARALMTPGELMTMNENSAVIFNKGVSPIFARKINLPAPTTTLAKARLRWSYHPYAYASGVVSLLLLLALWPLLRSYNASTSVPPSVVASTTGEDVARSDVRMRGKTVNEPMFVSPTPTPTQTAPLSWVMTELAPGPQGTMIELQRKKYATEAECSAGLQAKRLLLQHTQQSGWQVTILQDTTTAVRWEQAQPGIKPSKHGAWCQHAGTAQSR